MPRKKKVKESYLERYERLKKETRGEVVKRETVIDGAITRTIITYENGEKSISEKVGNIRI